MEKSVEDFVSEASMNLERGSSGYVIWQIENIFIDNKSGDHLIAAANIVSEHISDTQFSQALVESNKLMDQALDIISGSDNISGEEWMLVISNLSAAHSVERFAKRTGRRAEIPLITPVMENMRVATQDFTDPSFQRQLQSARKRHPNPLPLPLGEASLS